VSTYHRPSHGISIPPHSIELNSADSAGLLPLPGIGPVFAGRIISYRELLGGYHHTGQLSEVYGMRPETIELIDQYLNIDTSLICKIPLNTASFRQLLRHPYLEYDDVKAIVNYRDVMGRITSLQEIKEHALLADSIVEWAGYYLDLSFE
jgi:DNA uptake protein ComE-like DNA-binding protein